MDAQSAPADKPKHDIKADIAAVSAVTYTVDTFGTLIFIVVFVEIVLLLGLNLYQKSRITSGERTLEEKQALLLTPNYRTINAEVNQVLSGNVLLSTTLKNKVDWPKFYAQLNAITPKDALISTFSVTENGSFKADGRTTSLDSLAKLMIAWQQGAGAVKTPFASAALASDGFTTSTGARQVTFSISGQINLGALK